MPYSAIVKLLRLCNRRASSVSAQGGQKAPVHQLNYRNLNAEDSRSQPGRLNCPKIIRNGDKLLLRNQATILANMTAGSDREAVMRAYIMIAAVAALAMIAVAQTASTEDRVIGAPDCTVDCSGQAANTDNGIGSSLPVDPNNYDDGSDN
jgi:hypothetical protein